jgi:type IV fimbrial biogenesis protein FimT
MLKKRITSGDFHHSGFTLIELMVTIAILSVLATVAIPEMSALLKNTKVRTATRQLVSTLQEMKLRAIKENAVTVMIIDEVNDAYTVFLDNDPENKALDTGEEIIAQVDLQSDKLDVTSNSLNKTLGFNGRGFLSYGSGTVTITNSSGKQKQIVINFMGNIRDE